MKQIFILTEENSKTFSQKEKHKIKHQPKQEEKKNNR